MKNTLVFILIFVLSVLSRWISHDWNFTLLGGAFLFAGAYFQDKKVSFLLMLSVLLVSDAVIGFHGQMLAVYFAYALTLVLGSRLKAEAPRIRVLGYSAAASFLFYAITNFSVWYQGQLYPLTFSGLVDCYVMGIPFYRNQLISDLLSSLAFFEAARIAATFEAKASDSSF